jgi:hypothetical protein
MQTALPRVGVPTSRGALGMRRSVPVDLLKAAFHYDPDTGHLIWIGVNLRMLGKRAGSRSQRYRKVCVGGVRLFEHRVIWALVHGAWPDDEIDHINRDGFDNRLTNLRVVCREENCANRGVYKNNRLGAPCVKETRPGSFQARIQSGGNRVTLGTFPSLEAATRAVREAKRTFSGAN